MQYLGRLWQLGPNERSITFKGRFHYKEDLPYGNEEESYQESRQEEKEVNDFGEAFKPRRFCFFCRPPLVVCGGLLL
jgi:hypothetical protein